MLEFSSPRFFYSWHAECENEPVIVAGVDELFVYFGIRVGPAWGAVWGYDFGIGTVLQIALVTTGGNRAGVSGKMDKK